MNKIQALKKVLVQHFDWTSYKIDFLSQFMVAVIETQTVNLMRIAQAFSGTAKPESHYKRLQRFFRGFEVAQSLIARFVVCLLPLEGRWVLCLDRTNWKFGTLDINILVLAVAYKGIAVPLFWSLLPKRGNSNTEERIQLMNRFLEFFPLESIECLTADREFIGQQWFQYLIDTRIPFRIRIRNNTQIPSARGQQVMNASLLFRGLRIGEVQVFQKTRKIWGLSFYVVALRTPKDFVILLTTHQPSTALADYKKRWEIESLFGCLKSRGFHFEETHLHHLDRISNLLALLTLAFCWCYRCGMELHQKKSIVLKNHGRLAQSLFAKGLQFISNILFNQDCKPSQFQEIIGLLSCT